MQAFGNAGTNRCAAGETREGVQEKRGGTSGGSGEPLPTLRSEFITGKTFPDVASGVLRIDTARGKTNGGKIEPAITASMGVSQTVRIVRASPVSLAPAQQQFLLPAPSCAPQETQRQDTDVWAGGVTAENTELTALSEGRTNEAIPNETASVPPQNRSRITAIPIRKRPGFRRLTFIFCLQGLCRDVRPAVNSIVGGARQRSNVRTYNRNRAARSCSIASASLAWFSAEFSHVLAPEEWGRGITV